MVQWYSRWFAGSSLTGGTALCPWARDFVLCLILVQPRKTRPNITEKMLTGTYRINSNVPLAQLQRNRAGECLHNSLAAAQESLSFRVPTWSDMNMPVCWSAPYVAWESEWVCVQRTVNIWGNMETVPRFSVSSNRLDESGIELGTPGYKTSGLSTTPPLILRICIVVYNV